MNKAINHNNENVIILAAIASFTVIVVAGIWFLSSLQTRANNGGRPEQSSDDMDGHHSGEASRPQPRPWRPWWAKLCPILP